MEQVKKPPMCAPGRWCWRDETKSLEFVSAFASPDGKERKKRHKGLLLREVGVRHSDRASTDEGSVSSSTGWHPGGGSLQPASQQESDTVTVHHVKYVALSTLEETIEAQLSPSFVDMIMTQQFDDFLKSLLSYMSCFFVKIALEKRPKPLMAEPSASEQRELAEVLEAVACAHQHVACTYCVLLLGIGLQRHHHMACGSKKTSSTHSDRNMYEYLYELCILASWVTFRRQDLELIEQELSRLLRSDAFNLAPRAREDDLEEEEEVCNAGPEGRRRITQAEFRKMYPKRPAIMSVVTQRSPALVSLLPTPKEESLYLFKPLRLPVHTSTFPATAPGISTIPTAEECPEIKVGIIGEPLSLFVVSTLMPLEPEQEWGKEEELEMVPKETAGPSGGDSDLA
ncbi:protein phosphatase 1 regulatory subunit 36 [Lampetra fluviatilis]